MGKFNRGAKTNFNYMASDFVCGIVASLVTGAILGRDVFASHCYYFVLCMIFNILCIFINKGAKLYNVTLFFYADRIIKYVTKSFLYVTAMVTTLLFYVGRASIDKKFYTTFLICEYLILLLSAYFAHVITKSNRKLAPRTILVGDIKKFSKFVNYVKKSNLDLNIIGYISLYGKEEGYLGKLDDIEQIIHDHAIDNVYFMERRNLDIDIYPYIESCIDMGTTVGVVFGTYRTIDARSYISSIGTYPVVTYQTVALNNVSRAIKRFIDIIGSIAGIILSLPFMIITSIAIKINDPKGPVIFKQLRVGLNGRQFYIYKFRSMYADAEARKKDLMQLNEMDSDFMFKIKDDPRITKVGKVIRKYNIDELPQFFNVLTGDMSLVGTRPPTLDEVEKYKRNHWRRVSIRPGITGMWQVSGRSKISNFDEVVELDTIYIDSWEIFLDFKIMLKTVWNMIKRDKDAY